MLYNEELYKTAKTKEEVPDLTEPSLAGLAYYLRHRELWPEGFSWYFGNCESCAMGLAFRIWKKHSGFDQKPSGLWGLHSSVSKIQEVFDVPFSTAVHIFAQAGLPSSRLSNATMETIRPEHIAELIEAEL